MAERHYPVGIQTFSEIIRGGYVYIDKTDLVWQMQHKCAGGRTDVVVWMAETIYVFELKVTSSAEDAVSQIDEKGYAIPFETDGRKVVKVGVKFDKETRTPINWIIHE